MRNHSKSGEPVSQLSRRGFIKTASAGVLAAETLHPAVATAAPAPPTAGEITRLSENLLLLADTCNVYVIKDGTRALTIDFGSGRVLEVKADLGISKIERILHTHFHRDQAQGDGLAVKQGIPVFVPAHERHLFEDAENFWRNRQIYHLYAVRNDFFALTRNVPVGGILHDYESFRWGPYEFFVLPSPGHTAGSVSLVTTIDGKKVAFTGDVICAPGKVQNLYDLQYFYGGMEGFDLLESSLGSLAEAKPELVCPSHGAPIPDPSPAIAELKGKVAEWCEFWPGLSLTSHNSPIAVSPHLFAHSQTASSFYAIISDSGKALFVDYGAASGSFIRVFTAATSTFDRLRFIEHSIGLLKARHGLKQVDLALPSHMHDDHLNGFPHLVRHYGTKIWCYENMVDILQNPRGRNVGCILPEPIKVDRSLTNGETFRWEEFEFKVVHSPGHTNFQMAMFATIDGTRVAFTGDSFFPQNPGNPVETLRHNLIFRNDVQSDDHLRSLRAIMDFEPELIAPGHGGPFRMTKAAAEKHERRLKKQQQHFQSLIANPDTDFGLDPSWVHIYPYQMVILPGETKPAQVRVRNHGAQPLKVQATLVLPPAWKSEPAVLSFDVPPLKTASGDLLLHVPRSYSSAGVRTAIAADVTVNGKRLGQIAEAVVELRPGIW
jgi:glyoxylase-like metal-dependent hydrolase (beta-lactamase superfamily II)